MRPTNQAGRRKSLNVPGRIWQLSVLGFVGLFVWTQRHQVVDAVHLIRSAPRGWLLALTLAALALHASMSASLRAVIRVVGPKIPFRNAFVTRAEREMVAAIMPFRGIASYAVLVQRFGRFGLTTGDAGAATLLYTIVGHVSFLLVVVPTLG